MTFAVHVKGGTGAGRKRPPRQKPGAWTCECAEQKPGYLRSCVACGQTRPEDR
jgi:hypothetical protein